MAEPKAKKKSKKIVNDGIVKVYSSFNNTIITVTDRQGNTLCWATAGSDFKGSRKSTPFAAQVATEKAMRKAVDDYGLSSVEVEIRGPGPGREACVRAIIALDNTEDDSDEGGSEGSSGGHYHRGRGRSRGLVKITSIKDVTGLPHNGCRPSKQRRV